MKIISASWLVVLFLAFGCGSAANSDPATKEIATQKGNKKEILVGFYNVENLFDIYDNPEKEDHEFLPDGKYKWTSEKYIKKLDNLAKAIINMGSNGPDMLGVAEVENKMVMEDLVKLTALKKRGYKVVHEESMDMRGIDVGMIYDPKVFKYVKHEAFNVDFPNEPNYTSRPILIVEGKVKNETLFIVVNHWPSRRGGPEVSEPRRIAVATKVREVLAGIYGEDANANVLIMGDFNDDHFNKSISEILNASGEMGNNSDYLNPLASLHEPDSVGTLTYRGKWNLFDQILVSKGLLDNDSGKLKYMDQSANIHRPEFMQVGGRGAAKDMPKRAIFRNEFQENGFSDHFPVYLKLSLK